MAVFQIAARTVSPELEAEILRVFGDDVYQYADNIWFVSSSKTVKQIAEQLNLRKGGLRGAVVIQITPIYSGMANPEFWDWLRSSFESVYSA